MKLNVYMNIPHVIFNFEEEHAIEMNKHINNSIMNGFPLTNVATDVDGMKVQLNVDQITAMVWED